MSASDQTLTFTYNAAGQALSRAGANSAYNWPQPALGYTNYVPNGLNQYNTVAAASVSYDARGNLTSDGTSSYGYDLYNRLTSAGSASFAYDPAGRLYQSAGAATARFQYDGVDLIAEYNGSNVLQRRYVHGPSFDEPVVWYEGAGTSDRRWLVQDQLGSVIAVTNASGDALAINAYDEYGRPAAANQGRFQYTGQTWLSDASLYHYKARAYSPVLGRFMQTDPILYAGGMNLYEYVGGDSINFSDPYGLAWWFPVGMAVGGGVELGVQLSQNDWRLDRVDWADVGVSALFGAVGGHASFLGNAARVGKVALPGLGEAAFNGTQRIILGAHAAALGAAAGYGRAAYTDRNPARAAFSGAFSSFHPFFGVFAYATYVAWEGWVSVPTASVVVGIGDFTSQDGRHRSREPIYWGNSPGRVNDSDRPRDTRSTCRRMPNCPRGR